MPTVPTIVKRFSIIAGDTLPVLEIAVTRESTGLAYDFVGHTQPQFSMRKRGAITSKVKLSTATIASPTTLGKLQYYWVTGDTNEPGIYYGQFSALDGTGKPVSFPNDAYIEITVLPNLDT
jgi:hypothetical protein